MYLVSVLLMLLPVKKNTVACFSPRHDTIRINGTVYASMFPEEQHITVRQKENLPPRMFQFKTA